MCLCVSVVSARPCLSQPATEAAGPWQVYSGGGEYGDVHMDIVSICRSVAVQLNGSQTTHTQNNLRGFKGLWKC